MPGFLNACDFEMLPEDVPSPGFKFGPTEKLITVLLWGRVKTNEFHRTLVFWVDEHLFGIHGYKVLSSCCWTNPNLGQGAFLVRRWGSEKAQL